MKNPKIFSKNGRFSPNSSNAKSEIKAANEITKILGVQTITLLINTLFISDSLSMMCVYLFTVASFLWNVKQNKVIHKSKSEKMS